MAITYNSSSGIAAPTAWIERLAGDIDVIGGVIQNSLARQMITAASQTGYLTLGDGSRATSCDALLGAFYQRTRSNGQSIVIPTVVVTILNSLFQPLTLQPYSGTEDTLNAHGASDPGLYYPFYGSTTRVIPAARPHPTKPQTFLLGLGMFGFLGNAWNNCCGAMQFSYNGENVGPYLGIAYYSHGSSPAAAAVTADVNAYGGLSNFYNLTLDVSPQRPAASSTSSVVTIMGLADPTSFSPNTTFVTAWVRPNFANYTVQDNDTLIGIADTFYRDGSLYERIYFANQDVISDPNVIGTGMVLKIPELV